MEFSRQEYWSGLPFPSPGDLPDPGMETASLASPALADGLLPLVPSGKTMTLIIVAYSENHRQTLASIISHPLALVPKKSRGSANG